MRTLIVEDNVEKRSKIVNALNAIPGFNKDLADFTDNVASSKRMLMSNFFDLMILDIALPMSYEGDPRPDAGSSLLEEIFSHIDVYNTPDHIIGITAYDESYISAAKNFSSRLLTLIHYDPSSVEWVDALQARVKHIINSTDDREEQPEEYRSDLVVVCALYSPELTAILDLPWDWQQKFITGDHTDYWQGTYLREGKQRVVHVAQISRMGMPATAVLCTKMIHTFRPRYLAMTGITAGVRGRTEFGDILAADPCWDWGSGKWVTADDRDRFLAAPHQTKLSVNIRRQLLNLSRDSSFLSSLRANWEGDRPSGPPSLRLGPLASGASVLADKSTIARITEQHRELLGVEMEAYGVFVAAEEASEPRPEAFVLKSVVDFADGSKDDKFQTYAAYTSAQVLRRFCEDFI